MDLFNTKALKEHYGELLNQAKAINSLCKKEDREPTDEETNRLTAILDVEIPDIKAKIEKAEKYEAELAHVASSNSDGGSIASTPLNRTWELGNTPGDSKPENEGPLSGRITIPQDNLLHVGTLKAFVGPKAREQAYIAGRFYLAALYNHEPSVIWCRDHGVETRPQSALEEGDNKLGGVLVPAELEQRIIVLREERGVAAREAYIQTMGSDTLDIPRWVSGPTTYYVGEGDSITESDINYDNIKLVAKKLAALVLVSSELNEDAIVSIGDQITQHAAYAFADAEDKALFLGDGTSTYGKQTGLVSALNAGSVYTAITGNTAYGTLDLADFENMVGQLPVYAQMNAKWYIHKTGWARSMQRLADAAGGNTTETLASGMTQRMFLGYPVVFVQVMNSTTAAQTDAAGVCYFGDLAQAAILGRRRGMSIAVSNDYKFANDQLAVRAIQRFVVNVHERGDATTCGSIVRMDMPSS